MNAQIQSAKNTLELAEFVEKTASDMGVELDNSLSYGEQANYFDKLDSHSELVKILREADVRWYEVDDAPHTCLKNKQENYCVQSGSITETVL